jgi:hypothetical protein
MLGPSGSALIRLGARFPACMKTVPDVPVTLNLPCKLAFVGCAAHVEPSTPFKGLNDTANPADRLCTVEELCGHGGFHGQEPNQWWR